ncbi:hypothetical protein RJ639_027466 [Escallonia herrerae]|uniref:Uncharacterized protein n=1 Tax=Escallonia herrerae TaxID=1293975 RepID=A0AA88X3L0_9ASTE|nr:hypothetical protein RJ639_027466 [Escallonia herrerae]
MPLNPLENMPTSLARQTFAVDNFFESVNELKLNGRSNDQRIEGYKKTFPAEKLENGGGPSHVSLAPYPVLSLLKQGEGQVTPTNIESQARTGPKQTAINPQTLAQIQAKEADVQALAELTRALDKKEAVVFELRRMNDDVLENQKDDNSALKVSDPFRKQYAAVLTQLNQANEQVPMTNLGDSDGILNSFDDSASHTEESGSHVNEIVESSRTKAHTMVDAAMQGGGNTIEKIEESIDYVNDRLPLDDSHSADLVNGNLASQEQLTSRTLNSVQSPDPKKDASDKTETPIPSDLITHCVATLLMIQRCTERQFPPAEVAQILDSAVTSLQPCCSQNLPVYAEIQKCMGIIRNQILALIPT